MESGSTCADALGRFPRTFDDLFRNLVAAGEVGGILDTFLNRLAIQLEKSSKVGRTVRSAMTYPVIVLVVAIGVVALLLLKVIPTFEAMFAEMGQTLPLLTRMVIAASRWMQDWFWLVIIAVVGLVVAFPMAYRSHAGRLLFDHFVPLNARLFERKIILLRSPKEPHSIRQRGQPKRTPSKPQRQPERIVPQPKTPRSGLGIARSPRGQAEAYPERRRRESRAVWKLSS